MVKKNYFFECDVRLSENDKKVLSKKLSKEINDSEIVVLQKGIKLVAVTNNLTGEVKFNNDTYNVYINEQYCNE